MIEESTPNVMVNSSIDDSERMTETRGTSYNGGGPLSNSNGTGSQANHMVNAINNLIQNVGIAAANANGAADSKWYHEAIVDAVNIESAAYIRQLEAQSASYLRESRSNLGWRWTAGNKEGTLTYGWRLSGSSYIGNSSNSAANTNSSLNNAGTKRLGMFDVSESVSLAPLPSEVRARIHPALKWQHRAEELKVILDTGTPVNLPVKDGEEWFIIDATW